jgi:hypothetical protein
MSSFNLFYFFYLSKFRDIEDKPEGELSLQIHTVTRLNQRKKLGRCSIVLSKLEDGKALETWYSFSKKKRKGAFKSRGYLKVKVMWISAVVCESIYLYLHRIFKYIFNLQCRLVTKTF